MAVKQRAPRRRSESEWRAIVERFERSGMTATAFCRKSKIRLNSLRFWRWKLRRSNSVDSTGLTEFVEMRPAVPLARPSDIGPLPFSHTFRRTIDVIFPDGTSARMGG